MARQETRPGRAAADAATAGSVALRAAAAQSGHQVLAAPMSPPTSRPPGRRPARGDRRPVRPGGEGPEGGARHRSAATRHLAGRRRSTPPALGRLRQYGAERLVVGPSGLEPLEQRLTPGQPFAAERQGPAPDARRCPTPIWPPPRRRRPAARAAGGPVPGRPQPGRPRGPPGAAGRGGRHARRLGPAQPLLSAVLRRPQDQPRHPHRPPWTSTSPTSPVRRPPANPWSGLWPNGGTPPQSDARHDRDRPPAGWLVAQVVGPEQPRARGRRAGPAHQPGRARWSATTGRARKPPAADYLKAAGARLNDVAGQGPGPERPAGHAHRPAGQDPDLAAQRQPPSPSRCGSGWRATSSGSPSGAERCITLPPQNTTERFVVESPLLGCLPSRHQRDVAGRRPAGQPQRAHHPVHRGERRGRLPHRRRRRVPAGVVGQRPAPLPPQRRRRAGRWPAGSPPGCPTPRRCRRGAAVPSEHGLSSRTRPLQRPRWPSGRPCPASPG